MFCTKCGNEAPDGAAACTNCGAPLEATAVGGAQAAPPGSFAAPPAGTSGAPGVAHTAGTGQFQFDFNRLTRYDRIIGIASLVLLIALFVPFVTASASETINGSTSTLYSASADGYSLHGYFWIVFILCLAVIAYMVMKAGFATMPFQLPISEDQLLLGVTGLMFIIVLLGFIFTGFGLGDHYNGGGGVPGIATYSYHAGVSKSFGAYLALVASVVAVVPLGWPFVQSMRNKSNPTPPAA